MKIKLPSLIVKFFFLLVLLLSARVVLAQDKTIYYFYGQGCPHCAKVKEYFSRNNFYQKYVIDSREVYFNRDNAQILTALFDEYKVAKKERGVPVVFIGNRYLVGDKSILTEFEPLADAFLAARGSSKPLPSIKKPFDLTLTAVIAAAVVDAINPCAFAVLLLLLAGTAIIIRDKIALFSGLSFSLAIFISYFLMGLGLYKVFSLGTFPSVFRKFLGVIAVILGLWNVKDYLAYRKILPALEIPLSWRPRMKSIIKRVTSPAGAFAVGFVVSLFLLPCTSGPYIVILAMLSQKATQVKAVSYLFLYNLIFVSPMIIITLLVYFGLEPEKLQREREKNIKKLHLMAGIILLLLGIAMVGGWL